MNEGQWNRLRRSHQLEVGDVVQSNFRAAWTGVVEKITVPLSNKDKQHVVCWITHDRRGNPLRKPVRFIPLDSLWLCLVHCPHPRRQEQCEDS
jgi:hypothetical protein